MSTRDEWQRAFDTAPARDADFDTMSGVPVEPVYGTDDSEYPGVYPYTRGPYASMYRSKLWTMRMFAGFGTAVDTNKRFHELLAAGSDGLSTAFDLPTLMGRDSDDALALGEVGKCGVAVDSLADVEDLYRGIDLGSVTTSMTINGPAAIVFAMFVANAEDSGVERVRLGGTLQNDILKEYQAQKEFIFPPRPSLRLVRDTMTFCTRGYAEVAHDLGVGLPHPRSGLDGGAGTRVHASRTASRTSSSASQPGSMSTSSRRGCRSSSTPTSTSSKRSRSTAPRAGSGPAG